MKNVILELGIISVCVIVGVLGYSALLSMACAFGVVVFEIIKTLS